MQVFYELIVPVDGADEIIQFGMPDSDKEMEEMYRLRYDIYSGRGYIEEERYPEHLEKDAYDSNGDAIYFIARIKDRIIGSVRLIRSSELPIFHYYDFEEPEPAKKLDENQKGELGRLVIEAYDKDNEIYLPRGLVMLFLLKSVVEYAKTKGISFAYAFIKKKLQRKMDKLKMPVGLINDFKLHCPEEDTLFKYFSKRNDPVVPTYYEAEKFVKYVERMTSNKLMFKAEENKIRLRKNLYNAVLKFLRLL